MWAEGPLPGRKVALSRNHLGEYLHCGFSTRLQNFEKRMTAVQVPDPPPPLASVCGILRPLELLRQTVLSSARGWDDKWRTNPWRPCFLCASYGEGSCILAEDLMLYWGPWNTRAWQDHRRRVSPLCSPISWDGHGFPGYCSPSPAVRKLPLLIQQSYCSDFLSWVRNDPLGRNWGGSCVLEKQHCGCGPKACTQQKYLFLRPCLLWCRQTNVEHQPIHHTGHW